MSQTFSLVCHETKQAIRIGHGHDNQMTVFYSGDSNCVQKLKEFLIQTHGKAIVLLRDDADGDLIED